MKPKFEKEFDMVKAARVADILLPYLNWDVDPTGLIVVGEEDGSISFYPKIEGMYLKYPSFPIENQDLEIPFDLYNHTKIAYFCLNWCNTINNWPVDLIYLTNKKMDTIGRLEVKYQNGTKVASNAYYKDSLKYADFILKILGAAPIHYNKLRELDIK